MSSDSDLVRLAQGGQLAAYEELVRRWSARMLAVCHAKVRSAHTADELAWSRPAPTPDSLTELVEGVEQERPA